MKEMKNTPLILLIPLLIAACTKTAPAPAPVTEQFDKYIFFSPQIETKAGLVETAEDMEAFSVMGFKYDKDDAWWHFVKGETTAQNVFSDGNGNMIPIEAVSRHTEGDNSYYSYSPLQGWSNTKKYAFFACYPQVFDKLIFSDADGLSYDIAKGGAPFLRYEQDSNEPLKELMVDVMTASDTISYWHSSDDNNVPNGEINFTFSHRLSSLGVKIRNSSAGDIQINSVKLTVSGVKYNQIIIPFDIKTSPVKEEYVYPDESYNFVLTLPDDDPNDDATAWIVAPSEANVAPSDAYNEIHDKLIFIPQETEISVKVTVEHKRLPTDDYAGWTDICEVTLPVQKTQLLEGFKHLISLNFTDSTVEVKGVADTGWADQPDVENSFN